MNEIKSFEYNGCIYIPVFDPDLADRYAITLRNSAYEVYDKEQEAVVFPNIDNLTNLSFYHTVEPDVSKANMYIRDRIIIINFESYKRFEKTHYYISRNGAVYDRKNNEILHIVIAPDLEEPFIDLDKNRISIWELIKRTWYPDDDMKLLTTNRWLTSASCFTKALDAEIISLVSTKSINQTLIAEDQFTDAIPIEDIDNTIHGSDDEIPYPCPLPSYYEELYISKYNTLYSTRLHKYLPVHRFYTGETNNKIYDFSHKYKSCVEGNRVFTIGGLLSWSEYRIMPEETDYILSISLIRRNKLQIEQIQIVDTIVFPLFMINGIRAIKINDRYLLECNIKNVFVSEHGEVVSLHGNQVLRYFIFINWKGPCVRLDNETTAHVMKLQYAAWYRVRLKGRYRVKSLSNSRMIASMEYIRPDNIALDEYNKRLDKKLHNIYVESFNNYRDIKKWLGI